MSSTARILLLDYGETAGPLIEKIRRDGYTPIAGDTAATATASVVRERPDLIMVNGSSGDGDGLELIRSLKADPETRLIPVLLVNPGHSLDQGAQGFEAGVDDVIELPVSDAKLSEHMRSLVRLHSVHRELMRRRDTMERFTVDVPPEDLGFVDLSDARVMAVGKSIEASEIAALSEALSVDRCDDPFTARERLQGGGYDAVIVFAGKGETADILTFCSDVRNNSRLFNLPLLLVIDDPNFAESEAAYRRHISDVLIEPLEPADLKLRTLAWVRQQRYREQLARATHNPAHIYTLDGLTSLYSRGFLLEYLSDLIADCGPVHKVFSVGFLAISDLDEINREHGYAAGDHLLRQVGQLIGQLVRAEDLPARFRGDEFCILLPETPIETAHLVIERIAGVVQRTDFLVMGAMKVLNPTLAPGIAEFRVGDEPLALVERAERQAREWAARE